MSPFDDRFSGAVRISQPIGQLDAVCRVMVRRCAERIGTPIRSAGAGTGVSKRIAESEKNATIGFRHDPQIGPANIELFHKARDLRVRTSDRADDTNANFLNHRRFGLRIRKSADKRA